MRPEISFFCRRAYCLLSAQGVSPAMSALASSTAPKLTTAANAAAARAAFPAPRTPSLTSDPSWTAQRTVLEDRGVLVDTRPGLRVLVLGKVEAWLEG